MSIRPLPWDVVAQIKSSTVITSLNGVVSDLVQNSLDGDATKISVSVDYARGNCTIEDNGCGIPPAAFREDGGLGKLYYTSKYPPNPELHGRHGTFLASLSALSVMTIASHHQEYKSHNALTIQNSKMVARNVPALPEQQVLASTSGTRVTVRDLFGFMPVRVKQRAIEVDRLGSAKNFDHLVSSIIALLAAWTKAVMVTIRDAGSRRTMSLQSSESASRLAKLLTQADIIEEESLKSWVSLGASAPGISVSGCISLKPVATKRLQFISLGVRPLLNEHSSILYDEVNRVFAESTFGVVEQVDNEDTREKAKKSIDRWPVFYLRIDLGMDSLDNDALLDGSGHNELGMTTDLLRMMAYEFLRKHHYQPRAINAFEELRASRGTGTEERSVKRRRGNKHGAASPSDTRASHQASPFTSWARVKPDTSGRVLEKMPDDKISSISASLAGEGSDGQDENLQAWKPLFTPSGKLVRAPFEDEEPPDEGAGASTQETQEAKTVTWVDPSSKKRTVVDGRTGFMVKASGLRGQMDFSPRALPHLPSRVFKAKEPVIPRIPDMPEGLDSSAHHNCQEVCGVKIGAGGATLKALEGRISKDRLRKAEVIGQVDHKFILANVSSASGSMLVLIDQHAADERCRVEDLMRRYFGESGADTEILEKPLQFELSIREGQLLRRFREHFLHWGVSYDVVENITGKNACSVEVQALPPSIVERCRLEPRLLVELLRMESWRMCDHPGTCEETVQGKDWVARFHRCPEGIQELINSRACRSAIMFNDPLTTGECRQLVQRLAECAFPFQCAHGRPSMVPLVDLGGHVGAEHEDGEVLGLNGLKKWAKERIP